MSEENAALSAEPAEENETPESPAPPAEQSLLEPLTLGGLQLSNRVVLTPLATGLASEAGLFTPELTAYLQARAAGGAGLLMTEAISVVAAPLTHGRMPRLAENEQIAGLRETAEALEATTPLVATLTHPPVEGVAALDPETLTGLPNLFAEAAWRAQTAGAQGVALEFGDGHLLGQLLSPATNSREDEFGGELESRLALPLRVLGAVRERIGAEYPLIACLTLDERLDGGLAGEEAEEVLKQIAAADVQAVLVTAGTVQSPSYSAPCHYVEPLLVPALAARAKELVGVPVIASGGFRKVESAAALLSAGQADAVGMPRALLADPTLVTRLRQGELDQLIPCIGCNQACLVDRGGSRKVRCVVNPRSGLEGEGLPLVSLPPRELVVVGGGPAGVTAAALAARRGFEVTLFEQAAELGGRFRLACVPPGKALLGRYVQWLQQALDSTRVNVRLGEAADYDTIRRLAPDVVVVAAGASLELPETLPGLDDPLFPDFVVTADQVLAGEVAVGQRVLIIGARRVGLETADYLAQDGRSVIVCESGPTPDVLVPPSVRPLLDQRLAAGKVRVLAGATVTRLRDTLVFVEQAGHSIQFDCLDTVVVACGWRRNNALAEQLAPHIPTVAVVGDAKNPRTAMAAIREAYTTVAAL